MAGLRDSNGTIVIDEREAQADIRKIEQAKSKLAEIRKLLDPSKLDDERMLGETRDALAETFNKMSRELTNWEEKCSLVSKYIAQVVEKYKRIDREYAGKVGHSSGSLFKGGGRSSREG